MKTIEQPGFRKKNVRREKQLFKKLPTKISLNLQFPCLPSLQLHCLSAPVPVDVSDDSNSSKRTIDGNVTLPSGENKEASIDDFKSSNNEVNSVDRRTASQMYQSQSEEEKASLRKFSYVSLDRTE